METKISIPKNYLDFLRTSVPPFWEMKTALARLKSVKGLANFYAQVMSNIIVSLYSFKGTLSATIPAPDCT